MRLVRNRCASYMTGNTMPISVEQQTAWFNGLDRSVVRPFVFELGAFTIGYGLIQRLPRYDGEGWWVSGGLMPAYRGQGHGKELFGRLADQANIAGEICWLEVRANNEPAIRTYRSLGFQLIDGTLKKNVDGDCVDVIEMFRNPQLGRRREVP